MGNYQNNPLTYRIESNLDFKSLKIGIVVSEWNSEITESLFSGAVEALANMGCKMEHLFRKDVPGSFELPLACQWFAEKKDIDAILALGCIIQGDTPHFTFICDSVANGIMQLNLKFGKPIVFGVLTTNTHTQALDRAGGKHGNKGEEAAVTALKMLAIKS